MASDRIVKIEIDDRGRLCVTPDSFAFEHIYRAAMEVHWDNDDRFLYSPKPREWSYEQWFGQIVDAAKDEYGCDLRITPETLWENVSSEIKEKLLHLGVTRG